MDSSDGLSNSSGLKIKLHWDAGKFPLSIKLSPISLSADLCGIEQKLSTSVAHPALQSKVILG